MLPEEKWNRLNNPKTLEDYGLSLNEDELQSFPEGKVLLQSIKRIEASKEKDRKLFLEMDNYFEKISKNMKETIDNIIIEVQDAQRNPDS